MRYIVSYDISNNTIRGRIDKTMKDYGQRVQKSVFECKLEPARMHELVQLLDKKRLGKGSDPGDSIRVYPLCAACSDKVIVLGFRPPLVTETNVVII